MKTLLTVTMLLLIISCADTDAPAIAQKTVEVVETTPEPEPEPGPVTETDDGVQVTDESTPEVVEQPEITESEPVQEPETPVITEPETPEPEPEPEPTEPITDNPVKFSFYVNDAMYVYDGTTIIKWIDGKTTPVGQNMFANGTYIYTYGANGEILNTENIVYTPDFGFCKSGSLYGADRIAPADAYASGALYKDYTKLTIDGVEYGDWQDRQYYLSEFLSIGDDIFTRELNNTIHHINGTRDIKVISGGLVIEDYSATGKIAKFNGVNVTWTLNFMNSATEWLYNGDKYVSGNGYIFDGAGLMENGNKMADFRSSPYPISGLSEAPVIIGACVRESSGDNLFYWIECNTGWLFSYNARLDVVTPIYRLYLGNGLRATGISNSKVLNPLLSGDLLIFSYTDGYMYEYNFTTGLVRQIYNNPEWVRGW